MTILQPYRTRESFQSNWFDQMEEFFSDLTATSNHGMYDERSFHPACEVSESDESFLISMDLPGLRKEDLKIEITNNTLAVSGERKRMGAENAKLQRFERSYGFFKRSFSLPSTVDAGKIQAHYEDGVLELFVPKAELAKPRQIEVQTGRNGIFEKLLGSKKHNSESPGKTS